MTRESKRGEEDKVRRSKDGEMGSREEERDAVLSAGSLAEVTLISNDSDSGIRSNSCAANMSDPTC